MSKSQDSSGRIAVIEDDAAVRESVAFSLSEEGFEVLEFEDGLQAWEFVEAESPALPMDVVVLDVMMPRMDGLELCRRLRGLSQTLPILFLTSRDEEFDRVLGLELGADDYLCKPFSMRELVARIRVLFRRLQLLETVGLSDGEGEGPLVAGDLRLDEERYEATWAGRPLRLTITEFLLVRALARRPGHVKTRASLLDESYPHDSYKSERTIDTHVKRLRRKFVELDPGFEALETVYGVGYRLKEQSAERGSAR